MGKYVVECVEKITYQMEVDADSNEEAIKKADSMLSVSQEHAAEYITDSLSDIYVI